MNISDRRLIARLKSGEKEAFLDVVNRYYKSIYNQHWQLTGSLEEAADLTQETFIESWKSLPGFAGKSSIRTWLYAVAINVWRQSKRACPPSALHLDSLSDTLRDPSATPSEALELNDTYEQIHHNLLRLSPSYREAIILHYIQGIRYREIAVILDVPIGTVKSRLHDGMKQMRSFMNSTVEGVAA